MKVASSKYLYRLCNCCKEDEPIDVKELTVASFQIALCRSCRNKLIDVLLEERWREENES